MQKRKKDDKIKMDARNVRIFIFFIGIIVLALIINTFVSSLHAISLQLTCKFLFTIVSYIVCFFVLAPYIIKYIKEYCINNNNTINNIYDSLKNGDAKIVIPKNEDPFYVIMYKTKGDFYARYINIKNNNIIITFKCYDDEKEILCKSMPIEDFNKNYKFV